MSGMSPPNNKFNYIKMIGFQDGSECYDDFNCDQRKNAHLLHSTFAGLCFFLCLAGLVMNPVCLPAFNIAANRSGATFYLTIILICDTLYIFFVMILYVVRYMPITYQDQMEMYASFTSYLIPSCLPFISFFELVVVWLILALLIDRLLYLKVGFQSKTMLSRALSIKVSCLFIFAIFCYTIPKFLEYKTHPTENLAIARVVYTSIGKNHYYKKLMHNWLKVPLEIFFPYLGVGVFSVMVVMKMVDLHISKWKAVVSYCDNIQCCGQSCKDTADYVEEPQGNDTIMLPSESNDVWRISTSVSDNLNNGCPDTASRQQDMLHDEVHEEETFIKMSDLPNGDKIAMTSYIISVEAETRENANVVISVTLGFLLIFFKIPKFLLHVLENEQYAVYDPNSYKATNYLLDVIYASIKPLVCLLVGAHFRKALLVACCSCFYSQSKKKSDSIAEKTSIKEPIDVESNKKDKYTVHKKALLQGDIKL